MEELLALRDAIVEERNFAASHNRANRDLANRAVEHKDLHDYFRGKEDAYGYMVSRLDAILMNKPVERVR